MRWTEIWLVIIPWAPETPALLPRCPGPDCPHCTHLVSPDGHPHWSPDPPLTSDLWWLQTSCSHPDAQRHHHHLDTILILEKMAVSQWSHDGLAYGLLVLLFLCFPDFLLWGHEDICGCSALSPGQWSPRCECRLLLLRVPAPTLAILQPGLSPVCGGRAPGIPLTSSILCTLRVVGGSVQFQNFQNITEACMGSAYQLHTVADVSKEMKTGGWFDSSF